MKKVDPLLVVLSAVVSLTFCSSSDAWAQSQDLTEIITPAEAELRRPVRPSSSPTVGGGKIRLAPKQSDSKQSQQDPCQLARERFVTSTMLYDANRDQQLAYHEVQNLLFALGQSQLSIRNNSTSPTSTNASGNSATNPDAPSAFDAQDPLVASQQLQAFVGVFMQVIRQFDGNGDAQLNSTELLGFADMLMQFDPNLAGEDCIRSRALNALRRSTPSLQAVQTGLQQTATQVQANGTTAYNLCPANGAVPSTGSSIPPLSGTPTVPAAPAAGTGTGTTTPSVPGLQQGFSGE